MKQIIYSDKLRDVLVISKPSDNYFMLDLSEYSIEEQEYYETAYKKLHDDYIKSIKELGVSSNYRYFKKDKVEWVGDEK